MAWPLSPKWKVLGRWNYDHSNSRNLERFAGLEYSNCCSVIRLVAREWVDENALLIPNLKPNNGIFIQVTLNGLGDLTGGGLNNLLMQGIRGFKDQRQR
jgi:LPS-assembly protein